MSLRSLKHALEYAAFRTLEWSLWILPRGARIRMARSLLRVGGKLKLDKLALENLDRAYGDSISREEKKRILRDLYGNLARTLSELTEHRREGLPYVQRMIDTDESVRPIHHAIEKGRGVIFVTPHFGNWELMPDWGRSQNLQGVLVGKHLANPYLDSFLSEMRTRSGVQIVFHDESGRRLLRALEANQVVGLLPDLDTTRLEGIFIPFFGQPTYTPTSPASLSIISGAPIVPLFMIHEGGRYRMVADTAIEPGPKRSEEEIRRITQAWSDSFEKWIRKYPGQWMWFQRRWTTTPENAPRKVARRRQAAADQG